MTRVAIYARTSTDKAQTVENQLRQLTEVGVRRGWTVVAIHADEGVSGTKGRDRRLGFDAVLRGVARREFDLIAVWSICRLGRSLQDLVGFPAEVQARGVGLYCHTQALDSTTPAAQRRDWALHYLSGKLPRTGNSPLTHEAYLTSRKTTDPRAGG